jgi:hypothetical protein
MWFLILAACCVVGPYLLGIQPRTERERTMIAVTMGFLAWILWFLTTLRST